MILMVIMRWRQQINDTCCHADDGIGDEQRCCSRGNYDFNGYYDE